MPRQVHCYDYVPLPLERVREALQNDGVCMFERATQAATGRARSLVSALRLTVGGIEIGKNIVIRVTEVQVAPKSNEGELEGAMKLDLEWTAETHPRLFPSMRATLVASSVLPEETRLDLFGAYDPPGGAFGSAADHVIGHRIAEACVHRFLDELASRLCQELA